MGVVRDINKNEYQFRQISLSDVNTIKGLIKFRSMIDDYYYFDPEELKDIQKVSKLIAKEEAKRNGNKLMLRNINEDKYSASVINGVNQELINIYLDLDDLIEKISLSEKQYSVIYMLMCGLTEEDVAFYYGQRKNRITEILNTVCKKIKAEYDKQWKYNYIYMNHLKSPWEFKECRKCGENKPLNDDFYRVRSDNKGDGYRNECRICESGENFGKK